MNAAREARLLEMPCLVASSRRADGGETVVDHLLLVLVYGRQQRRLAAMHRRQLPAEQVRVAQRHVPPTPPVGGMLWIASPSSVTFVVFQGSTGTEVLIGTTMALSGSDSAMSQRRSGCQPSIIFPTRSLRASPLSPRTASGYASLRDTNAHST